MKEFIMAFLAILSSFIGSNFLKPPPKYEIISNGIVAESSRKISKEYGLQYIGNGASMMEDVKMLSLSFTSNKCEGIDPARKLAIDSVNLFLKDINSNQEIRPYLHNYPFTSKNIELTIYFRDKNCEQIGNRSISYVTASDGQINYRVKKNNRYADYHTETFEEAENILKAKKLFLQKS